MSSFSETISARIQQRLDALKLTERKASLMATGQPDAIRYIRARGVIPKASRLLKIAQVLQADPMWLFGEKEENDWEGVKDAFEHIGVFAPELLDNTEKFNIGDIGIFHSLLGESEIVEDLQGIPTLLTRSFTPASSAAPGFTIIGFAARPHWMEQENLIGLPVLDQSMSPIFAAGDVALVDINKGPQPGDLALVYLDAIGNWIIRKLVSKTGDGLVFQQFQPAATFRLAEEKVSSMARVLSYQDLIRHRR